MVFTYEIRGVHILIDFSEEWNSYSESEKSDLAIVKIVSLVKFPWKWYAVFIHSVPLNNCCMTLNLSATHFRAKKRLKIQQQKEKNCYNWQTSNGKNRFNSTRTSQHPFTVRTRKVNVEQFSFCTRTPHSRIHVYLVSIYHTVASGHAPSSCRSAIKIYKSKFFFCMRATRTKRIPD